MVYTIQHTTYGCVNMAIEYSESKSTGTIMVETVASLITAAFALVAALAWNEAIKALIARFVDSSDDLMGMLIYAILVTIIAVVATVWIGKVLIKYHRLDEEKKNRSKEKSE